MKTGTIYCIENKVNGKKYIGMSTDYKRRWKNHNKYLNKGKHHNIYLQRSWNKYGKENFEFKILEDNIKEENLSDREIYWIDYYNTFEGEGYNLTKGGEGMLGCEFSEKTKRKISNALIGRAFTEEHKRNLIENHPDVSGKNNYFYGKSHTEESKRKMSKEKLGIKFSEETKRKMSKNHADFSGENHPLFGKHHTKETKEKLRKINKGSNHPRAKLTKEKGLKIYKGYKNTNKTQKEVGIEFEISESCVNEIVNCKHWTTKGLKVRGE